MQKSRFRTSGSIESFRQNAVHRHLANRIRRIYSVHKHRYKIVLVLQGNFEASSIPLIHGGCGQKRAETER